MLNAVLALVFGLILFKERHTGIEYIGACLVTFSVVVICLQRGAKSNVDDEHPYQTHLYFSVLMILITTLSYGFMGVSSKYAAHFYNPYPEEYSMISMMISGSTGSLSGIFLLANDVTIDPAENSSLALSIVGAVLAGVFTTLGVYGTIKSISYGSLEVSLLFINMRVIVQAVEELFIFQIFPSLISCIGIVFALFGSALMIIYEHREAHLNKEAESPDKRPLLNTGLQY